MGASGYPGAAQGGKRKSETIRYQGNKYVERDEPKDRKLEHDELYKKWKVKSEEIQMVRAANVKEQWPVAVYKNAPLDSHLFLPSFVPSFRPFVRPSVRWTVCRSIGSSVGQSVGWSVGR